MVVYGGCSSTACVFLSPLFSISSAHGTPSLSSNNHPIVVGRRKGFNDRPSGCKPVFCPLGGYKPRFLHQPAQRLDKKSTFQCCLFSLMSGHRPKLEYDSSHQRAVKHTENFKNRFSILFVRLVVVIVLVMTISIAVSQTPSWALTEENLIFLEAWRTIDHAYLDKTFNGQSWFKYRENALCNEPMNNRKETYTAIKKMLATLDDPLTRFLEPEKFKSLRSGTRGALTGVGLSIGYPTGGDGAHAGLTVISPEKGGPVNRAGMLSGDVILEIDGISTDGMGIYDAAERLQGLEGSTVELTILNGLETKHLSLMEAVETLRRKNVNAFVLDLRDNSGGLFPDGIEIAKIWLDKGVIVYICDGKGVRDIYDTDGSSARAATEPLAVMVNKGTASASEILAGALKDNKRALVFGEPTYRKGKIQSVFQLSDSSGLAVTVARYETPAHTDIDKVGVIPDHPLPTSFHKDDQGFCRCLQDPASACHLNRMELFS